MSSWYHQSGQSSSHSKVVPCGPPGIGAWSMSLLWNPYRSNRYVFLVLFFLVPCYPAVDKVGSGRNKHTKKTNGAAPKPHRVAMGQASAPFGPAVNSSKLRLSLHQGILQLCESICNLFFPSDTRADISEPADGIGCAGSRTSLMSCSC